MPETEQEAKLTLSPEDYRRVLETGTVLGCADQLNVYIHDPDHLHEGSGYLRVRYEVGRDPVATLKIPVGWEGEIRKMVEVEAPLRQLGPPLSPWPRRVIPVEALPTEMARHFQALGIHRLLRLGWMRNLRCMMEFQGLGTVELDRTRLPSGEIHYEVEIETGDRALLRRLVTRIREIAPSAEISRLGKFSLFLEAIGTPGPDTGEAPSQE